MNVKQGNWLVAVSGGADSMALLAMCLEENVSCACAHVNYHHRPQAEEEEAYVRAFCSEHGIRCFVENRPFFWEGNFEAAARKHRYAFFSRIVKEYGFNGVLTAHHQDDLLETYFMQEEKGMTPEYYGLKEERMLEGVLVVRPLLGFTKRQLEDYCRQRRIRTFYDQTNSDLSLTRNRIRSEVVETLSAEGRAMVLREIERRNAELQERRCRIRAQMNEYGLTLERYRSDRKEDRLMALRTLAAPSVQSVSEGELKEADKALCSGKDVLIPFHGALLSAPYGVIRLLAEPEPYASVYADEQSLLRAEHPSFAVKPGTPGVNAVTLHAEDWPVTVRSPLPGDAIRMRFGTKPVHRFFIDRHIPRYERLLWPIVTNAAGEVILVPGLGCERWHYSICPTVSVLQLSRCK